MGRIPVGSTASSQRRSAGRAHKYKYLTTAQSHQSNPPFDPRILALRGPGAPKGGLDRGWLMTRDAAADWKVNFLYNPTTVSLQASSNADIPSGVNNKNDVGNLTITDAGMSVSWSLLFDRTYETWDRSKAKTTAGKYGVRADVRALYGMLGMYEAGQPNGFDTITNVMQNRPVQVYFGSSNALSYYGYVDGLTIDYTHWTTKMVPNRCVIGLSMKIIPADNTATPASGKKRNPYGKGGKKPT